MSREFIRAALTGLICTLPLCMQGATFEVSQLHPKASDEGQGTADAPWKTLAHAAKKVGAGDTVIVRDGIYRERVVVQRSGAEDKPIRFQAAPGAHVVLTGADRLTKWTQERETSVYSTAWPHRFVTWSKNMTHPGDEYHRLVGRCEQVMIDGFLLRQVLAREQLAPGTFFADVTNQTLFVWDIASRDPAKVFTEASVRQEILRIEGAHVQVRGLLFRYAANMAQHGAVVLEGSSNTLEDCVMERMNSSGATFSGENHTVRRCVFRDNGQLGFGANGAHRLHFVGCLVENNNVKGFDRGWEAGGDKLCLTRDAVLEQSRFLRNRGNGIWFDIGNENCTVQNCLIADNEDSGIFYEISFGLKAHDNVITGNGFAPTPGAWGAQAGISISSSPGCEVERNLIVGNREGFNFREQTRTTPRIGRKGDVAVWNHDEVIQSNIIAWNSDAQVWGWFDVKDERHWPAGSAARAGGKSGTARPGDIAAAYKSDDGAAPQGLTLEKLGIRFTRNVYFASAGQGWFNWGVTWGRHETYTSLDAFQKGLGLDQAGQILEPAFEDLIARNYRLKITASSDPFSACYPRGTVPGVVLGLEHK